MPPVPHRHTNVHPPLMTSPTCNPNSKYETPETYSPTAHTALPARRQEVENAMLALERPFPNVQYGSVLNMIAQYVYGCAHLSRDREHHVCT